MNEIETLLLKHLRKDSRKKIKEISQETSIPVTTLFDNFKKLKQKNIMIKHTSLVDFSKLNYFLNINFVIAGDKNTIVDKLDNLTHINNLYSIGNSQYYIECIFKNMKQMDEFMEKLEENNIKVLNEHHVIKEIKKEEFIPSFV